MDISIRKLSPDLADAYVDFFDATPHGDCCSENTCYCITWRNDDSYSGNGGHWFPSRAERRKRAVDFVHNGSIQGYLAYQENRIIGWCNSSADCQLGISTLRSWGWPIPESRADMKIKSIFCFAIAPDFRKSGVATQLVQYACRDAARDGFDLVEAYPDKCFTTPSAAMRGPFAMYEKCGFSVLAEQGDKIVVQKILRDKGH